MKHRQGTCTELSWLVSCEAGAVPPFRDMHYASAAPEIGKRAVDSNVRFRSGLVCGLSVDQRATLEATNDHEAAQDWCKRAGSSEPIATCSKTRSRLPPAKVRWRSGAGISSMLKAGGSLRQADWLAIRRASSTAGVR